MADQNLEIIRLNPFDETDQLRARVIAVARLELALQAPLLGSKSDSPEKLYRDKLKRDEQKLKYLQSATGCNNYKAYPTLQNGWCGIFCAYCINQVLGAGSVYWGLNPSLKQWGLCGSCIEAGHTDREDIREGDVGTGTGDANNKLASSHHFLIAAIDPQRQLAWCIDGNGGPDPAHRWCGGIIYEPSPRPFRAIGPYYRVLYPTQSASASP
jgi:hypothetical protein